MSKRSKLILQACGVPFSKTEQRRQVPPLHQQPSNKKVTEWLQRNKRDPPRRNQTSSASALKQKLVKESCVKRNDVTKNLFPASPQSKGNSNNSGANKDPSLKKNEYSAAISNGKNSYRSLKENESSTTESSSQNNHQSMKKNDSRPIIVHSSQNNDPSQKKNKCSGNFEVPSISNLNNCTAVIMSSSHAHSLKKNESSSTGIKSPNNDPLLKNKSIVQDAPVTMPCVTPSNIPAGLRSFPAPAKTSDVITSCSSGDDSIFYWEHQSSKGQKSMSKKVLFPEEIGNADTSDLGITPFFHNVNFHQGSDADFVLSPIVFDPFAEQTVDTQVTAVEGSTPVVKSLPNGATLIELEFTATPPTKAVNPSSLGNIHTADIFEESDTFLFENSDNKDPDYDPDDPDSDVSAASPQRKRKRYNPSPKNTSHKKDIVAGSNSKDNETSALILPNSPNNVIYEPNVEDFDLNGEPSESESDAQEASPAKKKREYNPPVKLTRKRQRNPDEWKSAKIKKLRRSGKEYVNRKGNTVPAKEVGPGCKHNCRSKCHERLTLRDRQEVHKKFYEKNESMKDTWHYVCQNVKKFTKAESRAGDDSRRKYSYKYHFRLRGKEISVCKTMFLSTLGISNSVVETAFGKLGEGGTISPCKRGLSSKNPRAIPLVVKDSVREHINLFPRVESHYIRKDSQREYLEEGLNVALMYKAYLKWMREKNSNNVTAEEEQIEEVLQEDIVDDISSDGECQDEPEMVEENIQSDIVIKDPHVATERQYRDIFNGEFNLGFHRPKKDQCDTCTVFNEAVGETKVSLQAAYDEHLEAKEKVRELKSKDKEVALQDPSVAFCCYDLQKVLYVPQGNASGFYYYSKLSTYNFTVFETRQGNNNKGYCFTWDQSIAKRGSNEIGSCLLKYFADAVKNNVKELYMYSDNCTGQNKNRNIFALYSYISARFNVKIVHRFLVKGHTQNEGDSMHARIELASKGKRLYVPSHWRMVMRNAKTKGEPYTVVKMTQSDFLDLKDLSSKQNWEKCEDKEAVHWLEIREVEVSNGNEVKIKYVLDQEVPNLVILNQRKARPVNLLTYKFKREYIAKVPLNDSTKKGLMAIAIKSGLIPEKYTKYYKYLCQ